MTETWNPLLFSFKTNIYLFVCLFIYLFIYILRRRGNGRGKERIPRRQALYCHHRAQGEAHCQDHEMMIWAEIKSWPLTWLSRQGAPHETLLILICKCLTSLFLIWSVRSLSLQTCIFKKQPQWSLVQISSPWNLWPPWLALSKFLYLYIFMAFISF